MLLPLFLGSSLPAQSAADRLFFDSTVPPEKSGADEIKAELTRQGASSTSAAVGAHQEAAAATSTAIPGKLRQAAAADIDPARHWPTGSIKGPLVGRQESNFRP